MGEIEDTSAERPQVFELFQNRPNPFNPATTIQYELHRSGQVRLRVYDSLGHEVATLVDGVREAGMHEIVFDGAGLASGMYFYRLEAEDAEKTGRMTLVK